MTEAKKKANAKYDKAHYTTLSVKVNHESAAKFRAACGYANITVNRQLKNFVEYVINNYEKRD